MQALLDKINKVWDNKIGHLNVDQRNKIIQILQSIDPEYVLEIGFAGGRHTSTVLATCERLIQMVSVDIDFDYMHGRHKIDELLEEFNQTIDFIEKDSSKLLDDQFFAKYFKSGLDYVFVDGCHTYDGAMYDMKACYKHLNSGGVMLVDDYMSGPPNGCEIQDVTNAVNDFAKQRELSFEVWNEKGKGLAIFRKTN